jgi:Holliday junction resolvasome RuvABC endonuclease subunit
MFTLAIDPGPVKSGYVVWDDEEECVVQSGVCPNEDIFPLMQGVTIDTSPISLVLIEKIASMGMAVGESVFETAVWSGKFMREAELEAIPVVRITRVQVKMAVCGSARAKDTNIRQALIDLFGPVGTKRNPGPLYGVSGDAWAALALIVAHRR